MDAPAQVTTTAFKKRHALKIFRDGLIAVINMVSDNFARTTTSTVKIWLA